MLIMPQLMVSLKRSDVEAMIRGLDRMSWRLVRALEARDLRGAGGEEEECFEEDASQEEECFDAKEAEEEDASQDRDKVEDNEEEELLHGEAEEGTGKKGKKGSGGKKGTGKSKDKPRSRSRSRNRHPPARPCYYKTRYQGDGCALRAVMKIWMRGKSARPKERFCCRACGEWLTSEGEDGAAPLADLHGDLYLG